MTQLLNLLLIQAMLLSSVAFANKLNSPELPLTHCYHWINEQSQKFLTFKYDQAKKNNGEFSFYTTQGNGAAAGDGIYCARTLIGSIGYGDRVVRLEFVPDVVFRDDTRGTGNTCGTNGKMATPDECKKKKPDVVYYNSANGWYVIKNPAVIKSWSAANDQVLADLNDILKEAPGYASNIQAAIVKTQQEISSTGKRSFINGKARFDLLEILKDPAKEAQISAIAMMQMVSGYPDEKLSKADKKKYLTKYMSKLVKSDDEISVSDLEALIIQDKDAEQILRLQLSQFDFKNLSQYNTKFIFEASQKKWILLTPDKEKIVWKNYVQSSADVNLYKNLMASNAQSKNFFSILPDPDSLVQAKNPTEWLAFLNGIPQTQGQTLKAQTAALFLNMILAGDVVSLKNYYTAITNKMMDKEEALLDAVDPNKQDASKMDSLVIASAVAGLDADSKNPKFIKIRNDLMKKPLTMSSKSTGEILNSYKDKKIILPAFLSEEAFFMKLVERSINEQYAVKNPKSTYWFILGELNSFFVQKINSVYGGAQKTGLIKEAEKFYLKLSEWLIRGNYNSYAYPAAISAGYYKRNMTEQKVNLQGLLENYKKGEALLDTVVENMLDKSFDKELLNDLAQANDTNSAKRMLNFVGSPEFIKEVERPQFKLSSADKKRWEMTPEFQSSKYQVDICDYVKYIEANPKTMQALASNWVAVKQNIATVKDELCD